MSDLTEDYVRSQLAILDGWLESAYQLAKEGRDTQLRLEELMQAMTAEEREAFWALYDRAELLLTKVATQVDADVDVLEREDYRGYAPLVFARVLASYDPDRSKLSTWIFREGRQHWKRCLRSASRMDLSQYERRVLQMTEAILGQEGTGVPTSELVDKVMQRSSKAEGRGREAVRRTIHKVRSWRVESHSRQAEFEDDGTRAMSDMIAASSATSLDLYKLGEEVAKQAGKEDLWSFLQHQPNQTDE